MNIDKPWIDYIANRTFGMELEFADGDKQCISLPVGYKWTDNKLTMMNNSDGSGCHTPRSIWWRDKHSSIPLLCGRLTGVERLHQNNERCRKLPHVE